MDLGSAIRICTKCKGEFPASPNFFFREKNGRYGLSARCKPCRKIEQRPHKKAYLKRNPLLRKLYMIRRRCRDKNHKAYKYYGAKGIKCLLTRRELKMLWVRDEAYQMENPSLDRMNPERDYSFENCRFVELKENLSRRRNAPHGSYTSKYRKRFGKTLQEIADQFKKSTATVYRIIKKYPDWKPNEPLPS